MKFPRLLSLAVLALAVSSCDSLVSTPDGKLPAQFLGAAQSLTGTYQGMFNFKSAELTLSLNGDMPVLDYTDAMGHDILGKFCGSRIGKLERLAASGDSSNPQTIDEAVFEFDPGNCPIRGRELAVDFRVDSASHQVIVGVSILQDSYVIQDPGYPVCTIDAHGHNYCYIAGGGFHTIEHYITGQFRRNI